MSAELTDLSVSELTVPPADDDWLYVVDKSDTTTAPASAGGSSKRTKVATAAPAFLRKIGYVTPSGDVSGAADVTAINNIISAGGSCRLVHTGVGWGGGDTPFYIGSPLLPATGSSLRGDRPYMSSETDNYGAGAGTSGGSVLIAPATFSGPAVIDLANTSGTQMHGVTLEDFTIDGASVMPAGHGIRVHGAWGAGIIEGVCVNGPFADCLHFEGDTGTSKDPDDWMVRGCKFAGSFSGYGVYAANIPDSWFLYNEASGNALDNWYVSFSLNTVVGFCKGENSAGGSGFRFGGQGGTGRVVRVIGCGSHFNNKDGFTFDDSGSGSGGIYRLIGCSAVDDGQAGGSTYAGYRSTGSKSLVSAVGCDSSGAAFGAYQGSGAAGMKFTSGSLAGTVAGARDDRSNKQVLVYAEPDGTPDAGAIVLRALAV